MVWRANDNFGDYLDECIALGACEPAVTWCNQFRALTMLEFIQQHWQVDPIVEDDWIGWVLTVGPDLGVALRAAFRQPLKSYFSLVLYLGRYENRFDASERQGILDRMVDVLAESLTHRQLVRLRNRAGDLLTAEQLARVEAGIRVSSEDDA